MMDIKKLREAYINIMINGSTRWVTCADMETNEDGEFKGYMAQSLWEDVFLPLLQEVLDEPK